MWSMYVAVALAQSPALPVRGETALAPCLVEQAACGEWLTTLLGETMVEQAFALQRNSHGSSALISRGFGVVTEVGYDTVALGRDENADGTRRTANPVPVVPRVGLGFQYGSFTYDRPYPQFGFGMHLLPPVPVQGTSAFGTGLDASFAFPVNRYLWLGTELDYTLAIVLGNLVATEEQLGNLAALDDYVDIGDIRTTCADGCQDRFTAHTLSYRVGVAVDPVPALTLYARGGVNWLGHRLEVDYDGSRWLQGGFQPTAHAGVAVRIVDKVQISTGVVTAWKNQYLRTDDTPVIAKVQGALTYRWGLQRYWEDPPEPTSPPEEPLELTPAD